MMTPIKKFVNSLPELTIERICIDYQDYENTGKISPKSDLMIQTIEFMKTINDGIHTNVWMKNLAFEAYQTYFKVN